MHQNLLRERLARPVPTSQLIGRWGLLLALLLFGTGAWAQTTKTLPGDYVSFTQAINDINLNFPAGGVTVNVVAGYTETAPAGGLPLLTAQGTGGAAGQIIFQKSGGGPNPQITAGVGTLTPTTLTAPADAIVRLSGADYVTFDGIDLVDANTSQATAAEFGYAFFRQSATNGCLSNTIQNCTVTMNRSGSASNGLSYGVYLATTDATGTAVTPTAAAGSNSGNRFYANIILNTQTGIYVNGFNAASPYTLADQNNDIGGTAASTGNAIRNFGGVAVAAYGVYAVYQQSPNASYNTVENAAGGGAATASALFGLYVAAGASGNINLNNNGVTLVQAPTATTANQATAVYSSHTGTGTANLNNNVVTYSMTASGTASANGRIMVQSANSTAIGALNMNGNQVTYNLSSTAAGSAISGSSYGIQCAGPVTGAASVSGNNPITFNITNSSTSAITSNIYGVIVNSSAIGGSLTMTGNIVSHVLALSSTGTTTTGSLAGIVNFSPVTGSLVLSGNTETFSGSNSSTTFSSAMFGFSNQAAGTVGGTTTITTNTVNYGISAASPLTNSTGTMSGGMQAISNLAALSGTATITGNTVNHYLAGTSGILSSALLGVSNSGAITGAGTIATNVLTYSGTRTAGTFSSAYTGINNSGATASTLLIDGNTLLGGSTASTGAMTIISAGGNGAGLVTISNNRYQNSSTASTGTVYFITNATSTSSNIMVTGNSLTGLARTGVGGTYGYYNYGTTAVAGTHTLSNNTLTGITLTGASQFIGLFSITNVVTTYSVTGNAIGSNAGGGGISTGAANVVGMLVGGYSAGGSVFSGNTVQNLTGSSLVVGMSTSNASASATGANPLYTASVSFQGGTISGNIFSNLNTTGVASAVYGLFLPAATNATTTAGNKISDLSSSGTGATTAYGIYVAAGPTHTLANNVVGNLTAAASTTSPAVVGLYLNAGTTLNAYYNTVNLSGSGGTNFGAAGIAFTGTPTTITLNNNLVVNTATATGTGQSVALGRVAAGTANIVPANLSSSTNSNLLYASSGTIYAEGLATATPTNAKTTLFSYRNFMYTAPGANNSSLSREQRTISQAVSFVSTTGTATNFLMPDASAPVESGALPISGITTDYAGVTRSTTPDIGAYEGSYTYVDLVAPGITYAPLSNNASTTTRAFASVAVVDVAPGSGVNTTNGTKPRVYYKLSTDANAYNDNTSGTAGWKFVEANGNATPFDFTIDYSMLPTAPAVGTIIQYFVVAQDLAATPNAALDAGMFATFQTSVALSSGAFPIGGTINQYTIVAPLPTTILVGTGQPYTSLTNTGGAFEAINNGVLAANTTVTITSDLTGELGTVALAPLADNGNNYTLTVQSDGTLRSILGTSTAATGLVRLAGASRVTFTGAQPTATSQNLLFRNGNSSGPTFNLTADASNNTLTNLAAESSNTSVTSGTIVLGSGTSTGNNNNLLTNLDIRSAANVTSATYYAGVYSAGLNGTVANTGNTLSNSTVHNFSNSGVYVNTNSSTWTVSGNSFYQEAARTAALIPVRIASGNNHTVSSNSIYQTTGTVATFTGISIIGSGTGHTVSGNFVGGAAANATSGTLTATGTFTGIVITAGTAAASSVQGNTVRAITVTNTSTTTSGINVTAGAVNVGGTTGNVIGGTAAGQAITTNYDVTGISVASAVASTISNNTLQNLLTGTAPGLGLYFTGLSVSGAPGHTISNNTVAGLVNGALPDNANNYNAQTIGILSTATGAVTVNDNQVSNVGNTATATAALYGHFVVGLYLSVPSAGYQAQRNRISNVYTSTTGAGTADILFGLYTSGTSGTVANNQVSLATATSTAPALYGLYEVGTGNTTAFNSVYLAGTGTSGTSAYYRASTGATTVRNNIFYNERTGSGSNYAIATNSAAGFVGSTANPSTNTSDYNLFFTTDATKVGAIGATGYSFANWKTTTSGDGSSMSETSAVVPSASLFTSTATGDLSLQASNSVAWYANGTGTQVASIGADYIGTPRPTVVAAGAPDIGSTEVAPTATPPALAVSAAPSLGGTQTFSLGGRTLASFTYGSTGTVPTSVTARYYSGSNPPPPFAAGAKYANTYFTFSDDNTDGSGYTYQPTLYYDAALLGTIASASQQRISQRAADNSSYTTYFGTSVSTVARTLLGPDLNRLGLLAISDAANPLPVELASFDVLREGTDAVLRWTTASELRNKGFEVQVSADGKSFRALGFVAGAGSSTLAQGYRYADREADKAGLRYYRLRQVDVDGTAHFSPVRTLQFEAGTRAQLLAWPNPYQQALQVSVTLPQAATAATLTLTDALGRQVLRQELGALPAGASQPALDARTFSQLPAGVYVLHLATPTSTQTLKLVKE